MHILGLHIQTEQTDSGVANVKMWVGFLKRKANLLTVIIIIIIIITVGSHSNSVSEFKRGVCRHVRQEG